jgi:hypothetical protein
MNHPIVDDESGLRLTVPYLDVHVRNRSGLYIIPMQLEYNEIHACIQTDRYTYITLDTLSLYIYYKELYRCF